MAQPYYVRKYELTIGEKKGETVYNIMPFFHGTIDTKMMSRMIAEESALTSADVEATINRIIFFCQTHLTLGYKIKLDGMGTLYLDLVRGKSVDSPEKADAKLVKVIRPKFAPEYKFIGGKANYALMPSGIKLQKVNYKGVPIGNPENGDSTDTSGN